MVSAKSETMGREEHSVDRSGLDQNFQILEPLVPMVFQGKFVWTNGPIASLSGKFVWTSGAESSSKVSP